jgi:hypothetical protein
MKRMLIRFYPAPWRARYGDEFLAVLEDRPVGPFDVADILLGALDAHLHLRGLGAASVHERGFAMSSRIGGYAAIAGGLLWGSGFAINLLDGSDEAWPSVGIVLAGTVFLLLALIGLSAFQARTYPALVWAAFLVPAIGAVLSIIGFIGSGLRGDEPLVAGVSAWAIMMLGLVSMVGGTGLFAIVTWRARTFSRSAAALLGVAAVVLLVAVLVGGSGLVPSVPAGVVAGAALVGFVAGWMALGWSAVHVGRPIVTSPGAAA